PAEDVPFEHLADEVTSIVPERRHEVLPREADGADAVAGRELEEQGEDHRMEVDVQMPVDVREAEARRGERVELGLDLAAQLGEAAPGDGAPRVPERGRDRRVAERAIG